MLWDMADSLIDERLGQRDASSQEDDFLSVLLSSDLDRESIRESIVSAIFGGQDNLVNVIAWSLYELMRRPVWIQRMRQEVEKNRREDHVVRYGSVSVRNRGSFLSKMQFTDLSHIMYTSL